MSIETNANRHLRDVFQIEKLGQCLSNKISLNYLFAQPVTTDFVSALSDLGRLEMLDFLPKPLFKITRPFEFFLVGVVGTREIRVDYDEDNILETQAVLEERFTRFLKSRPEKGVSEQ